MELTRIRAVSKKTVTVELTEGDFAGARAVCAADLSLGTYLAFTRGTDDVEKGEHVLQRFGREILIDWNLDDKDGDPLPANESGLMSVPIDLASALLKGWNEAMSGVPAPLGETSPDTLPLPAQPIPMVPLSANPPSSPTGSLSAVTESASA